MMLPLWDDRTAGDGLEHTRDEVFDALTRSAPGWGPASGKAA